MSQINSTTIFCAHPPTQAKKIFNLFYRGEDEMKRSTPGTGIGLALVKDLAERMGARVQLANSEIGAEFQVVFSAKNPPATE